ncbi:sugar kinase [Clostridiales bacterium COT073_COT-073]|nr:sugar kinase [Clostridiales bacterium COT073_COT-073]
MPEIVTIGETMAAFTPNSTGVLRYVRNFEMRIAGAESNLAIGVAKLGHEAGWISCLGKDEFGEFVRNSIRAEGVDTSRVIFDGEHRTGVMFKQIMNVSETSVFYYRDDSAASHMFPGMIDEDYLAEAEIIHLTGITPVLGDSCKRMVEAVMDMAKRHHRLISFDPNIRKKLWKNCDYASMLRDMTLQAQIVLLGMDEADILFGIDAPRQIMDILFTKGNAQYVAVKNGAKGAYVGKKGNLNKNTADIIQAEIDLSQELGFFYAAIPPYSCNCADPVGAGDAFNAAFLCGLLEGKDLVNCGYMGAVAGAMATETYGDIEGYPSRQQIEVALQGIDVIYR